MLAHDARTAKACCSFAFNSQTLLGNSDKCRRRSTSTFPCGSPSRILHAARNSSACIRSAARTRRKAGLVLQFGVRSILGRPRLRAASGFSTFDKLHLRCAFAKESQAGAVEGARRPHPPEINRQVAWDVSVYLSVGAGTIQARWTGYERQPRLARRMPLPPVYPRCWSGTSRHSRTEHAISDVLLFEIVARAALRPR
jgi:hypothetical protein